MQYVSNGAQLLTKKINVARRRMFLFADDVSTPTDKITLSQMISLMNKSRGFCARLNSDLSMACVRATGWKTNKLFLNYVPSISKTNAADSGATPKTVTNFDLFCRYYSVGKQAYSGTAYSGTNTLLESMSFASATAPISNDMVMPPFDGTTIPYVCLKVDKDLKSTDYNGGNITNGAGNILGSWTRSTQSYHQQTFVQSINADTSNVAYANSSFSNVAAGGVMQYAAGNFAGPRLFYAYRQETYGERLLSGGGWTYNYTTYVGALGPTTATDVANLYYGTGSHADTGPYSYAFGMMPIAYDERAPLLAVITKADTDFVQEEAVTPGEIPKMKMNTFDPFYVQSKFLM